MPRKRFPLLAWWYAAIAIGFTLLAIDHMILRDRTWLIVIRLVLAGGFAFLAQMEFAKQRRH